MRVTLGVISGLSASSRQALSVMMVSSDHHTSCHDLARYISAYSTIGHRYSSYPNDTHTDLHVSKILFLKANSLGCRSLVHFGGLSEIMITFYIRYILSCCME